MKVMLILMLLYLITIGNNPNHNYWQPYLFITMNDTNNIYEVVWNEKYGMSKLAHTKVIFRSKTGDYKLVSNIETIEIKAININSISFKKVPLYKQ